MKPDNWASPRLDQNRDQKMVSVLGPAGGRLHFEPRIRARVLASDPGSTFGLGLGAGCWLRFVGRNVVTQWCRPSREFASSAWLRIVQLLGGSGCVVFRVSHQVQADVWVVVGRMKSGVFCVVS